MPEVIIYSRPDCHLCDVIERIAQSHRGGGLAFARRRRGHRRHEDQLGIRTRRETVEVGQRNLCLVVALRLQGLVGNAEFFLGHLGNALHFCGLGNFDVGWHGNSLFLDLNEKH